MARIDIILQYPESMKKWLNSPEGKIFVDWVRDWGLASERELRESRDVVDIHRAQGKLEVLYRLLGLREEVETFLHRKQENKNDGRK